MSLVNLMNRVRAVDHAVVLTEMPIKAIADSYYPMIGVLHNQQLYRCRCARFGRALRKVVDRDVLECWSRERFPKRISNCNRMGFAG
jgi:hypothetical protein